MKHEIKGSVDYELTTDSATHTSNLKYDSCIENDIVVLMASRSLCERALDTLRENKKKAKGKTLQLINNRIDKLTHARYGLEILSSSMIEMFREIKLKALEVQNQEQSTESSQEKSE